MRAFQRRTCEFIRGDEYTGVLVPTAHRRTITLGKERAEHGCGGGRKIGQVDSEASLAGTGEAGGSVGVVFAVVNEQLVAGLVVALAVHSPVQMRAQQSQHHAHVVFNGTLGMRHHLRQHPRALRYVVRQRQRVIKALWIQRLRRDVIWDGKRRGLSTSS